MDGRMASQTNCGLESGPVWSRSMLGVFGFSAGAIVESRQLVLALALDLALALAPTLALGLALAGSLRAHGAGVTVHGWDDGSGLRARAGQTMLQLICTNNVRHNSQFPIPQSP